MTNHEFAVEPRLRLILSDLSAAIRVRRGGPGTATVELAGGDEEYPDVLKVDYDAVGNRLEVREDPPRRPVVQVTVAGTGNVVVGAGGVASGVRRTRTTTVASGGTIVSGGSVVGGTVTSGGEGVTVVNTGGRIVVNGVDVTDQVSGARSSESSGVAAATVPEPAVVTVVVPEGTDVGAERCVDLALQGVRGRVRAEVTGQSLLSAREATGARLTVTGQSRAELLRCSGPLGLTVTGQSRVVLDGEFGDVSLELSGQASVTGSGSFGEVTGNAAGMARVELAGPAAAQRVRTAGMASVRIGGPPRGGATGADWDF